MILVDTSVWIDFFGGAASEEKDSLRKLIINQKPIALTDIILTEILQGIREVRQYERVKQTLEGLKILHACRDKKPPLTAKFFSSFIFLLA